MFRGWKRFCVPSPWNFFCIYCLVSSVATKQLLSFWFVREAEFLKTELTELRMIKAERFVIGLPVEKNLQQDITTGNLNFTCGKEEIMSNFLAIPNQKSCLFFELKPLKAVSFNLPHGSRLPPNRYRGIERVFNSLSKSCPEWL